jgi:hypothetical protein
VARLGRETEAEAPALRDTCALACLTYMEDILKAYDLAPDVLDSRDVDDRAVDLWAPLLALAMVADVKAGGDRAERLLRAARELSEPREADDEGGQSGRSSGWRRKSAQSSPRPSCSRQFETADMDGSRARGVWRDSWLRSGLWLGMGARVVGGAGSTCSTRRS